MDAQEKIRRRNQKKMTRRRNAEKMRYLISLMADIGVVIITIAVLFLFVYWLFAW